jgi:pilus assembly protein CpaB
VGSTSTRDRRSLVADEDLKAVTWPGPIAPSWIARREDIVGRGVVSSVNKGEPFPENRLAAKGAGAGLAATIPSGMRAVAVKVDEVVGVSGFVLPGMRVDVLSSGTPPGSNGVVTRTILQNIEVLSAGKNTDRDVQDKPASVQVVNLLVAPEQAEALSLAGAHTRIQLVLRNVLDTASNRTSGISMNQLLLGAPEESRRAVRPRARRPDPPAAPPAAPPVKPVEPPAVPAKVETPSIEVINGQKRELVPIRDAGEPETK